MKCFDKNIETPGQEQNPGKGKMQIGFVVLIVLGIIIGIFLTPSDTSSGAESKQERSKEVSDQLNRLKRLGGPFVTTAKTPKGKLARWLAVGVAAAFFMIKEHEIIRKNKNLYFQDYKERKREQEKRRLIREIIKNKKFLIKNKDEPVLK